MIPVLFSLLIVAVLGTAVYVYLRREQDKLILKDGNESALDIPRLTPSQLFYRVYESALDLFKLIKHHPRQVLIFVGIACVHFLVVYILNGLNNILDASRGFWRVLIFFTLLIPNFILPIGEAPWSFMISSFTYGGVVGVFLTSQKIYFRLAGVIVIVLFIFAGFILTIGAMVVHTFT